MEKTVREKRSRGRNVSREAEERKNTTVPVSGEGGRSRVPASWMEEQQTEPAQRKPAKSRNSNFLVQGSILAAAGIIVRLIGMLYRIPLANYIGDEGNGYYSAAYNIYSTLLIMSSYSLPVAVSKLVSARLAVRQYRNANRILIASLLYATVAGGLCFCALWFGADFFAVSLIKMPFSSYALKTLAPTIWIMAYLGVLRGYFQGHSTMVPTAVSQIFEQIVNAVISLLAAKSLFDIGIRSNLVYGSDQYSAAFGAVGGTLGTGAGALTALICFLVLMVIYHPTMKRRIKKDRSGPVESYGYISSLMVMTIVPILVSSALYNSSTIVDSVLFGQAMSFLGQEGEIASQWGVYSGRYHLLFNIPVAIANALSSSLIPALSMAVASRDRKLMKTRISSVIRFSMIIAIPSAVGMTVLAAPISNLLFGGMDNAMLIRMTLLGSSAVVVFSLSTVTNGVLQGINRMRAPIRNAAISMVIHVLVLALMLWIFKLGIYGVLYANIIFGFTMCLLNARSIRRYVRYRQEILKTFLIPLAASGVMGAVAYGVYQLCSQFLGNQAVGNFIGTMAAVFVAVLVYFVLLLKLRGVEEQELRTMPGGTRVLSLARKLHLM